jgi:hypothetical protein
LDRCAKTSVQVQQRKEVARVSRQSGQQTRKPNFPSSPPATTCSAPVCAPTDRKAGSTGHDGTNESAEAAPADIAAGNTAADFTGAAAASMAESSEFANEVRVVLLDGIKKRVARPDAIGIPERFDERREFALPAAETFKGGWFVRVRVRGEISAKVFDRDRGASERRPA